MSDLVKETRETIAISLTVSVVALALMVYGVIAYLTG
jgi:hypothetical protein